MATLLEELQQENQELKNVILDLQDSILNPDKKEFPEALYELRQANNELWEENLYLTNFQEQVTEILFKKIDDEMIIREIFARGLTTENFVEIRDKIWKEEDLEKENQIGN